jgi:hypothetical protein
MEEAASRAGIRATARTLEVDAAGATSRVA